MNVIAPVMSVVTCGEAMGLFASQKASPLKDADRYVRVAAGAELNVATGLSRLGHRVGFVSRLGDDCLGHWLREVMSRENIDHRFVIQDTLHSTGLMFKSRRSDGGDPDIEYHRKGSAASHLGIDDYPASYCTAARHLHITGISPALSPSACALIFHMAREMRAAGRTVSFDPNLRAALWPSATVMRECLNELSGLADWVFPGLAEAQLLTGLDTVDDIVSFYIDKGCSRVAVKLGAAGAYYGTPTERGLCPGYVVSDVVDTVGAGDGFACGVISALIEGLPIAQAVDRGNLIGARVLGFPGDSDGLPTREEMSAFFQSAKQTDTHPSSPR